MSVLSGVQCDKWYIRTNVCWNYISWGFLWGRTLTSVQLLYVRGRKGERGWPCSEFLTRLLEALVRGCCLARKLGVTEKAQAMRFPLQWAASLGVCRLWGTRVQLKVSFLHEFLTPKFLHKLILKFLNISFVNNSKIKCIFFHFSSFLNQSVLDIGEIVL